MKMVPAILLKRFVEPASKMAWGARSLLHKFVDPLADPGIHV